MTKVPNKLPKTKIGKLSPAAALKIRTKAADILRGSAAGAAY